MAADPMKRPSFPVLGLAILFVAASPTSAAIQAKPAGSIAVTRALKSADFLTAKIALDRLVDPSINPASVEKQVARLADEARKIAGPRASEGAKIDAVRKVIYQAGPWNDFRPFSYDQADPFGQDIRNKLLSTYLRTRRGNCISMPALFLIVGRRIGLNLTLTTAPLHVLVRYTRPGIHPFNIESTSGGSFARDAWYRQKFPMSDRSIQSGVYLRTHTDKQTIALMAHTVVEYLVSAGRNEEAISSADAILAINPRDAHTLTKKGTAIAELMKGEFFDKYPTPDLVPVHLRLRYAELARTNARAFADAEALGWEETSLENQSVNKASVKTP